MIPVTKDQWDFHVIALSPLRERRLLQMAWHGCGDHKAHYGEFLFLMRERLIQWHLGTAFDGIGCDHVSILPRRCTCSRHDRPLPRRRLDTGMTGVFAPLPYAIGRILKSGSGEAHGSVHTHHKRTYFGLLEIKNKG